MNYYTATVLLDVAGAVETLPDFASGEGRSARRAIDERCHLRLLLLAVA